MEQPKKPGLLRRGAGRVGRFVRFSLVGDVSEVKQTHAFFKARVDRVLNASKYARTETFEQACERLGLSDRDVIRRASELRSAAVLYWGVAAIAFAIFCATPFVDNPLSHGLASFMVVCVALAKASVLRWRQAQCEHRSLMPYGADPAAVATYVITRDGRSGVIRTVGNDVEIGLARIPGREAKALAAHGITPEALANDDCLNITIAAYLMQRDALARVAAAPQAATPVATRPVVAVGTGNDQQCLVSAAQRYHLPAPILQAVVLTEGGWKGLKKRNSNGSYDLGPAQINTIHLRELAQYGVSERQLMNDVCVNLHVAAYRLRFEINRVGDLWRGVGNYHSRTPSLSAAYRERVRKNLARVSGGLL